MPICDSVHPALDRERQPKEIKKKRKRKAGADGVLARAGIRETAGFVLTFLSRALFTGGLLAPAVRFLVSTVVLAGAHEEVDGVRKEKERLTTDHQPLSQR